MTFGPSLVEGGVGPCDGPWSSGPSHEEVFVKPSGGKARSTGKSFHQHLQNGDTEGSTVNEMLVGEGQHDVGEGQHGASSLTTLEKSDIGQVKALCGPPTEVYKCNLAGFAKDESPFVDRAFF